MEPKENTRSQIYRLLQTRTEHSEAMNWELYATDKILEQVEAGYISKEEHYRIVNEIFQAGDIIIKDLLKEPSVLVLEGDEKAWLKLKKAYQNNIPEANSIPKDRVREIYNRAEVGLAALPKEPSEFWKGYWQGIKEKVGGLLGES